MRVELKPGDSAPSFEAVAVGGEYGDGRIVAPGDFAGRTLVLYFYPKDDTPGCTQQACLLRDKYGAFGRTEAVIFGVSVDSEASHAAFIRKHALPFPLISDPEKRIVRDYGVWVEKSLYGKKYMGTERSTFVIGPDGKVQSIFRRVKPAEHADTLIESLANFKP